MLDSGLEELNDVVEVALLTRELREVVVRRRVGRLSLRSRLKSRLSLGILAAMEVDKPQIVMGVGVGIIELLSGREERIRLLEVILVVVKDPCIELDVGILRSKGESTLEGCPRGSGMIAS